MEGKNIIVQIGPDGRLSTSSSLQTGAAEDDFYYTGSVPKKLTFTAQGGGGQIWGESTGSEVEGSKETDYESFFVGTQQEFEEAGRHPNP